MNTELVRDVFDASTDFTVGIEEEFAIVDPETRSLVQRFEELQAAARQDEVLAGSVAGELISSEIEIRSGRGDTFAEALAAQRETRARLFALTERQGLLLGATGTHPWSPWQQQRIIDTDHYQRVSDELRYVAWRNNTFGLHVHVGIQAADRAIAVCDRLRAVLPELLAISANSPFLDGRDSGLASARSQIFTRSFPRCGIPDAFGDFAAYADYVRFLAETGSIVEPTQIWWSVRPHHAFGTVEVRICDAQTRAHDAEALAGLIAAAIAQAALDHDDRIPYLSPPGRLIEENLWRAIRHGLDGRMIDLQRRDEFPAAALPDRLLAWTAPARAALGIEPQLPARNGAQRQRRALEAGDPIDEIYATELHDTALTYALGSGDSRTPTFVDHSESEEHQMPTHAVPELVGRPTRSDNAGDGQPMIATRPAQRTDMRGEAGGVPFVALPPEQAVDGAPLVVVWHLASPPRSETAMAAALPLRGLPAWRVYLGLPMLGSRLPEGGLDEFFRLFREDAVLNVFEPVTRAAVDELPGALAELRERLPVGDGPLALVGGSIGAGVAQSVVADTDLPVSPAALVSPAIRLRSVVARYERMWNFSYAWSERSLAVAERLDFVARADEIAAGDVATLLVLGVDDDADGFREPAEELREALARRSPKRVALMEVPGMGHPLAEEPGLEPAPQTAHAAEVDAAIVDWFGRHLNPAGYLEASG